MAQLTIDRVSKTFGKQDVLKDVSLDIDDGAFLVLVGPSGCGKSTLLNMVAGLIDLSSGEIHLDGVRIDNQAPKDRNMAMVFQSYALYPSMTVEKNIAFPLRMAGVSKADQRKKVNEVMTLLQIAHLCRRKPAQLSGGQRQRVAMGRALVRNPKLFLFDEPLSNLDAKLRVDMRTEIKLLHQRLGKTTIYVTHDQVEAMTMASQIAVMEGGVIQQLGRPEEIYDRPANMFVATFMGSPAMNILEVNLSNDGKSLQIGEQKLPIPPMAGSLQKNQPLKIGLRPEWFSLSGEGVPLHSEIELIEPTGPDVYVSILIENKRVMARLPASAMSDISGAGAIKSGAKCTFYVALAKAPIFDGKSGVALYSSSMV